MRLIKICFKLGLLVLVVWIFLSNWSFLFKSRIVGEVTAVEKVMGNVAVISSQSGNINPQVFSFSVAIKDLKSGEIHMASSEDRQWAAAQKGNCVVAAFFPYAPWELSKGNTNHNARLLRNYTSCDQIPQEQSFFDKIKFFFLWV